MAAIATLSVERAVMREVERDGSRRPYAIKATAGIAPANPMYAGMLRRLEQRGLVHCDGAAAWSLSDAGREALR